MRIVESPGILKQYQGTPWKFQQTFQTPLGDLPRFGGVVMSELAGIEQAKIIFQQVVFEPHYDLVRLYAKHSLPPKWYGDDLSIEAQGATEVRELLQAVLSEWIDFFCVPSPSPFVIFADHDEFITFLAHRKGPLSALVAALRKAKFRAVEYVRKF